MDEHESPEAIDAALNSAADFITGAGSEYERVTGTPRLKELYLRRHPETAPGKGKSKARQSAKSAPCFTKYAAERLGVSKRTVENRINDAEELAKLAPQARTACLGTALANKIGMLVRVTRIPDPAGQLLVVDACREHGLSRAKVVLKNLEEELVLCAIKVPETGSEEADDEEADDEEADDEEADDEEADDEEADDEEADDDPKVEARVLPQIMAALGARVPRECVAAIETLKSENARLREELAAARATAA